MESIKRSFLIFAACFLFLISSLFAPDFEVDTEKINLANSSIAKELSFVLEDLTSSKGLDFYTAAHYEAVDKAVNEFGLNEAERFALKSRIIASGGRDAQNDVNRNYDPFYQLTGKAQKKVIADLGKPGYEDFVGISKYGDGIRMTYAEEMFTNARANPFETPIPLSAWADIFARLGADTDRRHRLPDLPALVHGALSVNVPEEARAGLERVITNSDYLSRAEFHSLGHSLYHIVFNQRINLRGSIDQTTVSNDRIEFARQYLGAAIENAVNEKLEVHHLINENIMRDIFYEYLARAITVLQFTRLEVGEMFRAITYEEPGFKPYEQILTQVTRDTLERPPTHLKEHIDFKSSAAEFNNLCMLEGISKWASRERHVSIGEWSHIYRKFVDTFMEGAFGAENNIHERTARTLAMIILNSVQSHGMGQAKLEAFEEVFVREDARIAYDFLRERFLSHGLILDTLLSRGDGPTRTGARAWIAERVLKADKIARGIRTFSTDLFNFKQRDRLEYLRKYGTEAQRERARDTLIALDIAASKTDASRIARRARRGR